MKVTIIVEDSIVIIDGIVYEDIDLSSLDSDIHAIQWYDTYGEIEVKDSIQHKKDKNNSSYIERMNRFNLDIFDTYYFQHIVDKIQKDNTDANDKS